ncbi:Pr6Pr family membrane protein [Streptomyces aurantiogriseus]|uniref:Integral membrane regulator n=1 Tax=Streptomyces aurantiogriseus TaxID=66870 RepID=A0A918L0E6_9ACTN|nr:Pr6Pr family membrane protein [Streptomyces aurantiogriseus]GGR63470.1 integral membrane regulator [Streptomyces aurantiogriseus]
MTAPIPRDIPDLPALPRSHPLLPSFVPGAAVVLPARRPLATVLRLLIAATAAAGVTLALLLGSPLRVLSHFAVQSSILLALVTLLSARRAWTAGRSAPSVLTGAALLYVTITGLVYHLLLADAATPFSVTATTGTASGWHAVASHLLYTVTPTAAVLDWLLLTPPGRLHLRQAALWLLYPLPYLAFSLIRAELITPGTPGRYLYPSLDAAAHGYRDTLANTLLIGLSFYALGVLLVALDHARPDLTSHRAETGFRLQPPVG